MPSDITPTDFLKTAAGIAEHFGFRDAASLARDPICASCGAAPRHTASAADRRLDALSGMLASGIVAYTDQKLYAFETPVLLYSIEQVPRTGEAALTLHVFNVPKSIAEAVLIQTASAIARDVGQGEHVIRLNSLGDADSTARYTRELTNYFRKRANDLPPTARELMKAHVCDMLLHLIEKDHELAHRSPNSLEYLSDASRKHFREIVEYLDTSGMPYEIDPKLMGHFNCYSDTIFSIDTPDAHAPLVIRGGRYDAFMRRHLRHGVPAAGAVVVLRGKKAPRRSPRAPRTATPSVYVAHLGFGPKVRSLSLINTLRNAGVPVLQNLASDSLTEQLLDAETRGVRYTVLIGQKEFVDRTAILRDMVGRTQEQIPIDDLAARLKRIIRAHA